jgi:O-antigen ligase
MAGEGKAPTSAGEKGSDWAAPATGVAVALGLAGATAFLGERAPYAIAAIAAGGMLVLTVLRPVWSVYYFLTVVMLYREYSLLGHGQREITTIYNAGLPGSVTVYAFDLLLLAALGGLLLRAHWKQEPLRIARESVPLLLFIAIGPLFAVWGMINGATFLNAATDYRVAYRSVAVFLLAVTSLRTQRQAITAAGLMVGAGVLRVLLGDAKFFLHHGEKYFLGGVNVPVPFIEQADAQVCALVAVCALAYLLWPAQVPPLKQLLLGALVFLAASSGTILTLRRSAWLTMGVGMLVVGLFAIAKKRTWVMVAALLVALTVTLVVGGRQTNKLVDIGRVAVRITAALGEQPQSGVTSESVHYGELQDAIANVAEKPILGWGLGHLLKRRASAVVAELIPTPGRLMRVHDVYLDIWVKMGIVGLGIFLWWVIATTARIGRRARAMYREKGPYSWLYGGLFATWIGYLFASLGTTMIFGGNRIGIMFFGVAAVLLVWAAEAERGERASEAERAKAAEGPGEEA